MAYTITYLTLKTKAAEFEVEIQVEGEINDGGSNSYGSDEPAWSEVENLRLYRPHSATPLPRRVLASLTSADWDAVADALLESR